MADTPAPEVEKLPVVAYLRATKDGAPVWDEDCVCQDPVYPSDPDGSDAECVSMALVRQSDAEAEIARLRADAERWRAMRLLYAGVDWEYMCGPESFALFHLMTGVVSAGPDGADAIADAAFAAQAKGGAHG